MRHTHVSARELSPENRVLLSPPLSLSRERGREREATLSSCAPPRPATHARTAKVNKELNASHLRCNRRQTVLFEIQFACVIGRRRWPVVCRQTRYEQRSGRLNVPICFFNSVKGGGLTDYSPRKNRRSGSAARPHYPPRDQKVINTGRSWLTRTITRY